MAIRLNGSTIKMDNPPSIAITASVVGKKEGDGPLGRLFDVVNEDISLGEETWEKSEAGLQKQALDLAISKGQVAPTDIDFMFAGDLLNQCTGSTFGLRDFDIPFIGLFGACSTMAESLAMASLFVDTGIARKAVAITSSHFCSAERQFRLPLNYGGQRTPTAQWTVTGAGAAIMGIHDKPPYVQCITFGKIEDKGIKDANNMGAAMAPAAYQTIMQHFTNTGTTPDNYDLILTGDLGKVGSDILKDLFIRDGIDISEKHNDCGLMIYDIDKQDVHSGGSGCGCAASVLCGYIAPRIAQGELKNVLFTATGALMSPTIIQQGESIPSIAHAVHISG